MVRGGRGTRTTCDSYMASVIASRLEQVTPGLQKGYDIVEEGLSSVPLPFSSPVKSCLDGMQPTVVYRAVGSIATGYDSPDPYDTPYSDYSSQSWCVIQ